MNIIANTGIQIINFEIDIDPNADITRGLKFYEYFDTDELKVNLEFAHYFPELDKYVSRQSLFINGYIDTEGNVDKEPDINDLKEINPETEVFSIVDIENTISSLVDKWIPVPLFEKDNSGISIFGPSNWARILLSKKSQNAVDKRYSVTLAIDTTSIHAPTTKDHFKPYFEVEDQFKKFELCGRQEMLLDFCSEQKDCEWVHDYILRETLGSEDNIPQDFPAMKYLGEYIYLLHYLQKLGNFPEVILYPNRGESINIDLVLDIGNSRTCGLLYDNETAEKPFSKVKKLEIQNLTNPIKKSDDPFSMRLAFSKADFGGFGPSTGQFTWPSILRVGSEAQSLIYNSTTGIDIGKNTITNHSSPKRYLWDDKMSDVEWEYCLTDPDADNRSIFIEGVSDQFNSDGTFSKDSDFGLRTSYSKRSLMTFVFLEILAHATVQINSYQFRKDHGSIAIPRKLHRIVVTCPTAMVREEQRILRTAAKEASIVLQRYIDDSYKSSFDEDTFTHNVQIVPSLRDFMPTRGGDVPIKVDWPYDEATCNQMVFMYGEVSNRYLNDADKFFNLYGKKRYADEESNKKSITIASLDIGGGTTDLMICNYTYESEGKTILKPKPIYWESFNLAGDELLKTIVKDVILEGHIFDEELRGSIGVIQNHLLEKGISNVQERLNTFFGPDSNLINDEAKSIRRDFNVQISIPIALKYIELTQQKSRDFVMRFEDIFDNPKLQPNERILEAFEQHFGTSFKDIRWKFSRTRIDSIIEKVFEPMLKKIATLFFAHDCDFVLLAGKPTSLHKIEDLFLKFFPVSPDRIISLNKYRVGTWYPFADGNGYFQDQKSLVAVGAMVALLGDRLDKFIGFGFDLSILKDKLVSTANYIGAYDLRMKNVPKSSLTPIQHKSNLNIAGVPAFIGAKQLDTISYPSRVIFEIDFDDKAIRELIERRNGTGDASSSEVELYKSRIKSGMPLKLSITRDYRLNKENIKIESITNANGDELPAKLITLKLKTIAANNGYWLDNGAFVLSINPR
ncbi:virulence factor SrfB [Portibacter lacus]|uniref:Virulence factor SrfB n=1 Tax=Portibacter lacus TaxID=1099794 RepID=A0AA37SMS8_9BACT|nr:virulence factor SrfB [Portibacter lacus]GLR15879.1 hypothetical protein GCM10007940_04940 [Portibacter lacus]